MNLIEQLGGYARAIKMSKEWESSIDGDIPLDTMMYSYDFGIFSWGDLQSALLDYRRQHNIFEVGDLITHPVFWGLFQVKETMKHHVLGVTSTGYESKLAMELIRHATPEEIKAGKRL